MFVCLLYVCCLFFFFFSSRRRHTRCGRDWSSDVCSSDLVATSLGVILGIHPQAALICIAIFLVVFIASNYVSLGAIITSISFPLLVEFVFDNKNTSLLIFSILLSSAVVILHHNNIKRLIKGNENKMSLFKKKT